MNQLAFDFIEQQNLKGLPYTGSKFKYLKNILQYFPKEIGTFIEPFSGGLNVTLNVKANEYIINDISKIAGIYQLFQSYSLKGFIIPYLEKNKIENKNDYFKIRDYYNNFLINYRHSISDSLCLLNLMFSSFNNQIRFNNKNLFNMPFGDRTFNKDIHIDILKDIYNFFENNHVNISNLDYKDFLENYLINDIENTFIYLDPPYFNSDASYNKYFTSELFYKNIKEIIKKRYKLAISDNYSYLMDDLIKFMNENNILNRLIYIDSDYSNCNYQKKTSDTKEALLIINY